MTYFYELRAFNHKGECFDVREYGNEEIAKSKFNLFVSNTKAGRKRCLENNIKPTFLAYEMQLVKRDENYIGLVELKNWKVAA
tara:strand:+ start:277 stop:525 length:249 start_codon:yes stop_codon:yes gene_type:complete